MFSAEHARQLNSQYQIQREEQLQQQRRYEEQGPKLEYVLQRIERVASQGRTYIIVDQIKDSDTINKLKENGYTLHEGSHIHHDIRLKCWHEEVYGFWGNKKTILRSSREPVDTIYYYTIVSWGDPNDYMYEGCNYKKL